eukprot:2370478-Rhodomonas_salina.1
MRVGLFVRVLVGRKPGGGSRLESSDVVNHQPTNIEHQTASAIDRQRIEHREEGTETEGAAFERFGSA